MTTLLGIPFHKQNRQSSAHAISSRIDHPAPSAFHVVTANPETVMQAVRDPAFRLILQEADMVTPDGIGVVLASRMRRDPLPERVAGYDLIHDILTEREERKQPTRIFLLGGQRGIAEKASKTLQEQYTYIKIAGHHHGFFGENTTEEKQLIEQIAASRSDFLLAGLGSPRQSMFIHRHRHRLSVSVAIGCGGSLDVLAGNVKRAPSVFQKCGLEWFYRLLSQPSRLHRQLDLVRFVWHVWREGKKR